VILYRPTGLAELELVAATGWTGWPPRLPDQPIFYPVLTLDYARKIAREWNAIDAFSGYIGFVTRFELEEQFAARYRVQQAGGRAHQELWVPADDLAELNRHIIGRISVIESYPGPKYMGEVDPETNLPTDLAG
jgi:hypothetical protein